MNTLGADTRLAIGLCNLAFVTMLSYAVASSAAQSLFLSAYGSHQLPWVWMGVGLASALATAWLNRLSQRYDVVRLFNLACQGSALSLSFLLLLWHVKIPHVAFLLYVWKDVYIIVLVELFWTFANVVFGLRSASRTYGFFCAAGSAGSVMGNVALAAAARSVGTAATLWAIVPLLAVLALGCRRLTRNVPVPEPRHRQPSNVRQVWRSLCRSNYLPWLMVLVASVQGTLTLLDYRFSAALERMAPTEIARTAVLSQLYAIINGLSFLLQVGTAWLLRLLGLPLALLLVPCTVGLALLWTTLSGSFAAAASCMVVGKCLDYSLFRAAKELLYIPLDYAEKTQGKALVDIFTYRTAKAAMALLLLGLPLVGAMRDPTAPVAAGLLVLWFAAIAVILRRHRRLLASLQPKAAAPDAPVPAKLG